MKNKEQYRLPNGKYTTNVRRMISEWKDVYEPICDEFNIKVIGYDPNVLFKSEGGASFDLPVEFCIKLRDMIITKNENTSQLRRADNMIQHLKDVIDGAVT